MKEKEAKAPARRYTGMSILSMISLVLGLLTLIMGAAYLINNYFAERLYREKWKDYDDCGLA